MDLRALMNPASDGAAAAVPVAAHSPAQAQAPTAHGHPYSHQPYAYGHSPSPSQSQMPPHAAHSSPHPHLIKTPQRTVSMIQPPHAYPSTHPSPSPILHQHHAHSLPYNSHSPPPTVADKGPPSLPRTTSLPAQVTHYRRDSSASVSPKTMPMAPPAPVTYNQTPSPAMSRKRSLSISDHQHTPQPMAKKRKYDPRSPPPWARRERDGHRFVLTPRSEPNAPVTNNNHNSVTPQPTHPIKQEDHMQKPNSAPPPTPSQPPQHQPPPQNAHNMPPPQQQQPHPGPDMGGLEPSIDNLEPYNSMERAVCDFLFHHLITNDLRFSSPHTKIEIEAKLGSIKDWNDERSRLRMQPAILSDVVLDWSANAPRPKFESSMLTEQHARLNKYLNAVTQQNRAQQPNRVPIDYKHSKETDLFYDIPQYAMHLVDPQVLEWHNRSGARGAPRLRVTRDNASDKITATIIKTRIANLEVRCPSDEFDFRISISLETHWPHQGWDSFPEHLDRGVRTSRNKDRLSYRHQGYLVDLTQVTPFHKQGERVEKVHELEIEMDGGSLAEEGWKVVQGVGNRFEGMVRVFLNNVRVVNRAAKAVPVQGGQPMPQGMMGGGGQMR